MQEKIAIQFDVNSNTDIYDVALIHTTACESSRT